MDMNIVLAVFILYLFKYKKMSSLRRIVLQGSYGMEHFHVTNHGCVLWVVMTVSLFSSWSLIVLVVGVCVFVCFKCLSFAQLHCSDTTSFCKDFKNEANLGGWQASKTFPVLPRERHFEECQM